MPDGNAIITSSSGKRSTVKDPNATLDYPFDWSEWLTDASDTYASHEFVTTDPADSVADLTVESSAHSAGVITAFVSGGTEGMTHELTCRITTAGGRIDDRTLFIKIKQQ